MPVMEDVEIRSPEDFKRETARVVRLFAEHMLNTYEANPAFKGGVSREMAGKISFAMQVLEELAKMFEKAEFIKETKN